MTCTSDGAQPGARRPTLYGQVRHNTKGRRMSDLQAAPPTRMSHVPAPAVFLGALASEVNEPDELDPTFSTLADVTERIVAAVRTGAMAEAVAAEHLQALRLTGQDEVTWTIGATSLRWYRKTPDRNWKLAVPPAEADDHHRSDLARAVADLPADLIPQGEASTSTGYGVDPAVTMGGPAPAPWEYEPGDQQRIYGSGDRPTD